jgi:hypothetical protein
MSGIDRFRTLIAEHGRGLLTDLLFAVVWVTLIEILFSLLNGPQWAYYMFMLGGIVAYFGFFASLEAQRGEDRSDS